MKTGKTRTPERERRPSLRIDCDVRVLFIVLVLMGIGLSLVASSSSFFAGDHFDDHFALMRRHAGRCLIALVVLVLASRIDYRIYRKASPVLLAVAGLLLVGLFATGREIRGATRTLGLPFVDAVLQPAEVARLALVFFLAYWVTRRGAEIEDFKRGFLPAAVAVAAIVGLIAATPNYGSAAATFATAVVVLFIGGARPLHLAGFVAAVVATAAARIVQGGYALGRVLAFLGGGESSSASNWQRDQSLIALGSGGVFGVGPGESEQKLSWLPDAYTDFIYSVLGEEMGLLGTLVVSGLFLLLALRALKISRGCGDVFGEMVAAGVGVSIFVYAVLNTYVAAGMLPVTGLPLPFMSYGGSAMLVNALAVGGLVNVSRKRPGLRHAAA
jgi:cell division protein FtsW